MQYEKVIAKNFEQTCFAEYLLAMASEPRIMILILFIKLGKFQSGDSYKLYSYKEKCVIKIFVITFLSIC